jgi:hypothetical protein
MARSKTTVVKPARTRKTPTRKPATKRKTKKVKLAEALRDTPINQLAYLWAMTNHAARASCPCGCKTIRQAVAGTGSWFVDVVGRVDPSHMHPYQHNGVN